VPISTLLAAPYSLPYGSSIYAKVTSTNAYGTSIISEAKNGAVILTVPTTVVLSNSVLETNANQIVINWTQATENGGSVVLDYEIQYKVGAGAYSVLADGITALTYTFTGVGTGQSYTFKVRARNSEGFGNDSNEVTILAA
jgi:hypothetical protein